MFIFISILALLGALFTNPWLRVLFATLALMKVVSYAQGSGLELRYSKDNALFKEFVAKSKITQLRFEPFLFGLTPLCQGIFYMIAETAHKLLYKNDFSREFLTLPDGATIGIDWDGGIPDPKKQP